MSRGVCWKKWADLCKPLSLGGTGAKRLEEFQPGFIS